ncbi:MAG TPA: cyclic nucleotide-binding domain-containing protein [Actinomycetota bacterium]|nr:cyclic nucleotide-binding domain-containing protein [Actinomycetota bacterium]
MSKRAREALARVPLFANLSPRYLRRVADLCEEQRYMEGATIVRAGDIGDTFYTILEGQAKVVSPKGRVVNRVYPGDFFGEISLLDGGPRTASVVAETPMVMLGLSRRNFQSLLAAEPAVAVKLLQHSAGMLRRMAHPTNG